MKKLLLSTVLLLASSYTGVTAKSSREISGEDLTINSNFEDPTKGNGPIRRVKSVVSVPPVSIDDHTLIINKPYRGCTLQLFDENGVLQYSTIIPENYATIELPAYLKGDYNLQIVRGNFILYALYITL